MTDKITELYQSAGVDTESLEHRVRTRWNEVAPSERQKIIERITATKSYQFRRWDALPGYMQGAILRSIKLRKKRKDYARQVDKTQAKPGGSDRKDTGAGVDPAESGKRVRGGHQEG